MSAVGAAARVDATALCSRRDVHHAIPPGRVSGVGWGGGGKKGDSYRSCRRSCSAEANPVLVSTELLLGGGYATTALKARS